MSELNVEAPEPSHSAPPEPADRSAMEIAVQMLSNYVAGDIDEIGDPAEAVIDDPRLLGEVMVQLAVIGGEILKLATAQGSIDPQALLRQIVDSASPESSATP